MELRQGRFVPPAVVARRAGAGPANSGGGVVVYGDHGWVGVGGLGSEANGGAGEDRHASAVNWRVHGDAVDSALSVLG
jgi:hypothetical protein